MSALLNFSELPVGTHEGKSGILVLKDRFPRNSLPSTLLLWLAATSPCDWKWTWPVSFSEYGHSLLV